MWHFIVYVVHEEGEQVCSSPAILSSFYIYCVCVSHAQDCSLFLSTFVQCVLDHVHMCSCACRPEGNLWYSLIAPHLIYLLVYLLFF